MFKRPLAALAASVLGCGALAASATAGAAPTSRAGAPTATNGHAVQTFATGLTTPTSFAFGAGQVFEGDGGNPPAKAGGVYVLKEGQAVRLADSPPFVAGLAWHKDTLYVSSASMSAKGAPVSRILAWSGWNGKTFTKHRVFYTAPKDFPGFNGLAIGPNGRLYVGVDVALTGKNDHGPATAPYQYDLLTFSLDGKGPRVYASGIRQPWQIAFARGDARPYVTDLGQDADAKEPPDFVLHVREGDNYGFPTCNWTAGARCDGFTKPFQFFAPHSDVGGIAILGRTIYLTEFGFGATPPQVVAMPLKGGAPKVAVSGFSAPVIGLGAHSDWLYVGSLDGNVYRVHR